MVKRQVPEWMTTERTDLLLKDPERTHWYAIKFLIIPTNLPTVELALHKQSTMSTCFIVDHAQELPAGASL